MRGKDFLLQFLVNILPLDPDPDSGSQNVAEPTNPDPDPTNPDPDPKHWQTVYIYQDFVADEEEELGEEKGEEEGIAGGKVIDDLDGGGKVEDDLDGGGKVEDDLDGGGKVEDDLDGGGKVDEVEDEGEEESRVVIQNITATVLSAHREHSLKFNLFKD